MKKLSSLICLLAFATISQAQLSVGAEAGYTRAWMDYGNIILPEGAITHIHSYNVSTNFQYRFGKRFSIATNPGYARRGAACVPTIGWGWPRDTVNFPADSRLFLDYIDLPLMIQGHFSFGQGRWEVSPAVGYGVALLVHAQEEIFDLETFEVIESIDRRIGGGFSWNPGLKRFDHGLRGSLSIARNFGNYQLYAKTSYHYGFPNIERFMSSENRAINCNVGVLVSI